MKFNKDFIWGSATSSYQIEGAACHDGGGKSVWDMLCRHEGKIANGDTGEFSCDHYHRYKEDVSLMSQLGLQAYRFSISWPRVMPNGVGVINQKGLDFYSELVDTLLEHNIDPWVTLFHWDYPYDLYCKGGWLNRDSADWFADYTALVVDKLSDRVSQWSTINEPQCFIGLGHQDGIHAPGLQMAMPEVLLAGHNALRAHGKAVQVIRGNAKIPSFISAAHATKVSIPVSNEVADIEAARKHFFSVKEKSVFNNVWFSDPMILGRYPEQGLKLFEQDMPEILAGDFEDIHQKLDYFGANIYSGDHVQAKQGKNYQLAIKTDLPLTEMGWPITPEALYWGPKFYADRYQLPIVITENGMANLDKVENGKVFDRERIDYLYKYISEFSRASDDGIAVLGYFLWSMLDNFEWAEGYNKRFGIVRVDYETQQRTLKYSAHWYKKLIANHKASYSEKIPAMHEDSAELHAVEKNIVEKNDSEIA